MLNELLKAKPKQVIAGGRLNVDYGDFKTHTLLKLVD